MSPDALFAAASGAVIPGWLLLALAPGWAPGRRLVAAVVIPGLVAAAYVVILAAHLAGGGGDGGFGSLDGVRRLFADPWVLLAGWLHYLAFDLFIGAWEVRDARALGLPHLAVLPCLGLTFIAGPAGLLCYLGVRAAARRRFALGNETGVTPGETP